MWRPTNPPLPRIRRIWRRLWDLQARERILLAQALIWVSLIRVALYLVPFAWFRRALESLHQRPRFFSPHLQATRQQIIWAVTTASRRIPQATCLTQALSARLLLNRYGYDNALCIGVRLQQGDFLAHAWLEDDAGGVLIGQLADLEQYKKLPLESANVMF